MYLKTEIGKIYGDCYQNFKNIQIEFINNFDSKSEKINFDNFIPNIQNDLSKIKCAICNIIFDNDSYKWDDGNMHEWVLKCFYKRKSNNGLTSGYIIDLYYTGHLKRYFHSVCKNTLINIIENQLKYYGAKKRNIYKTIYIDDCEIYNLKDDCELLENMLTKNTLLHEINYKGLTNKEKQFLKMIIISKYEYGKIDNKIIKQKLNLSNEYYHNLMKRIETKLLI